MAIDKIVLEFQAETTKLKKELDTLKGRLGEVENKAQQSGKNITKSFENANTGVNNLSANLKSLAGTLGLALGAQQVIKFAKESVALANIQLKAEAQLLTALKGKKSVQEALIKQAAGLQKITTFGDEQIIQSQSLIAAFVSEEEQIKELTRVSLDFAAAKGIDLASAADLITKTFSSSTNALGRYALHVEGAAGSQERLQNITKVLDGAFKGQAETLAKTGTGGMQQLQGVISDVQEQIGMRLLPVISETSETLKTLLQNADWDEIFGGLEEVINDVAEPWREFFDAIGDVYRALTAGMSTGEKTAGVFNAIKVAVNFSLIPIKLFSKWLRIVVDNGIVPLINAGKNVIAWFNEVREGGGFVGAIFNGIASAAGAVVDKLVGIAQFIGIIDSAEETAAKNAKKREAERLKYAERINQATITRTKDEERLMALQAKRAYLGIKLTKEEEAELKRLTQATNENAKAAEERAKKMLEIQAQFKKEMMSLTDELTLLMIADEDERAKKQLEIQKKNDLASIDASEFSAEQKGQLKAKIEEKYNQLELTRQEEQNEKRKKLEQEVVDFIQSVKDEQRENELAAAKEDLSFANSIIEKSRKLSIKDVDEQEERFNKIAAAGLFTEEQLLLARQTFSKMREEVSNAEAQKLQENIAKSQEAFNKIANSVTSVTGPAFAAINALYDANLQKLENEKNKRLSNEKLTAKERLRIEEEYEKKKNDMMAEQFEVGRAEQIINATMAAAQAALNAFASTAAIPLVGPGLAAAAAAVAGAFGALQIGVIASQPNPYKFFDGTAYLQRGNNPKGRDTIPVMAHEGEAIIPTRNNLQYPGLAKSWIEGNLDKYINNNFVRPALMEQQRQAEEDFADRLAASMALQMSANFDDYRLHRDLKEQTAVLREGFQTMKINRKKLRGA